MSLRRQVFDLLDRRGNTRTLAILGTAYVTVRRGELCIVNHEDGDWIHRYRSGTVVQPKLGGWTAQDYDNWTHNELLCNYTPQDGDVVFDVGGGIGEQVRVFSDTVGPRGRVLSIEAHPRIFRCLERTVYRNSLKNVTALNLAVADTSGTVLISDDNNHVANAITDDAESGIEIESKTLDEIAAELEVDHIDLLKMNIEGAELVALRGMTKMLPRTRHVIIQCHDFAAEAYGAEWKRTLSGVQECLVETGFSVERRQDHPLPYFRDTLYGSRYT